MKQSFYHHHSCRRTAQSQSRLMPLTTVCLFLGCLWLTGCQSSVLEPSRMTGDLFGLKKQEPQAAASTPNSSHSEYLLGEEALQQGKWKEAKKHFQQVVQQNTDHSGAHHRLAFLADRDKEYAKAELHYLAAMKNAPKNPDIPCDLGYSYLLQDRYDDSRRTLEKALKINPQHQASLLNLGTLYGKQGDYAGALAWFRQAGSEQEAQQNIARLFPQGPPAGQSTELAAQQNPQISPTTRELQQKLAESRTKPPAAPGQHPASNAKQPSNGQEIPMHLLNDAFARIDAEAEANRQYAAAGNEGVSPVHYSEPGGFPAGMANHPGQNTHGVYAQAAPFPDVAPFPPAGQSPSGPESFSSLPGDLPVAPAGAPQHYAQQAPPMNNTPFNGAGHPPGNPYFTQPAADPTGLAASGLPMAAQNPLPSNPPQLTTAPLSMPPQTGITAAPPLTQPVGTAASHPFAHIGTTPAASGASAEYQQMLALAMQMGMNTGPGQMFPLSTAAPNNSPVNPGLVAGPPPTLPGVTIPGLTFPEIPASSLPPTSPVIQQVGNQEMPTQTAIPNWSHAPQSTPAASLPQTQTQTQTQNSNPANPPWLQQGLPVITGNGAEPTGQLPQTNPHTQHYVPEQWPHSPQAGKPAAGSPVIHRGTASMPAAGTPSSERLPEVIPATRQ